MRHAGGRGPWTPVAVIAHAGDRQSASGSSPEIPDLGRHGPYLPTPVRRQIAQAVPVASWQDSYLIQQSWDEVPRSQTLGHVRLDASTVIAILASRSLPELPSISPEQASVMLATQSWTVTTLTAQLGPAETVDLVPGHGRAQQERFAGPTQGSGQIGGPGRGRLGGG